MTFDVACWTNLANSKNSWGGWWHTVDVTLAKPSMDSESLFAGVQRSLEVVFCFAMAKYDGVIPF
jgi:hypothetical protein